MDTTNTPEAVKTGTHTGALVVGIVGLALSWIPFVGFAGFILGFVGLGLSIAKRNSHKVLLTGGLSIAAILLSTIVWFAFVGAVDDAFDDLEECWDAIGYDIENDADTSDEACE
jgi:chromate transport protein ChrA